MDNFFLIAQWYDFIVDLHLGFKFCTNFGMVRNERKKGVFLSKWQFTIIYLLF